MSEGVHLMDVPAKQEFISQSEVLFELFHDGGHPVGWDQHHGTVGLHGDVVEGPPPTEDRVSLLLDRVVELKGGLLWRHSQKVSDRLDGCT